MTGIEFVIRERHDHAQKHGHTVDHDIENNDSGQLIRAASVLIEKNPDVGEMPAYWDNDHCSKMVSKPYTERLVIAASLIVAEIDRLQTIKRDNITKLKDNNPI